jgi:hypothetical protein
MRRRIAVVAVAVIGFGLAGQVAGHASDNPVPKAVPPACVEQNLPAGLHFQIGYCP